jgi:hypothetical protein
MVHVLQMGMPQLNTSRKNACMLIFFLITHGRDAFYSSGAQVKTPRTVPSWYLWIYKQQSVQSS